MIKSCSITMRIAPPPMTAIGSLKSRILPYATINGDVITIHNIRNFDYRTETDFTPRWETRTYDLRHH